MFNSEGVWRFAQTPDYLAPQSTLAAIVPLAYSGTYFGPNPLWPQSTLAAIIPLRTLAHTLAAIYFGSNPHWQQSYLWRTLAHTLTLFCLFCAF